MITGSLSKGNRLFLAGKTIGVRCVGGYVHIGSPTATCTKMGVWTHVLQCSPKHSESILDVYYVMLLLSYIYSLRPITITSVCFRKGKNMQNDRTENGLLPTAQKSLRTQRRHHLALQRKSLSQRTNTFEMHTKRVLCSA